MTRALDVAFERQKAVENEDRTKRKLGNFGGNQKDTKTMQFSCFHSIFIKPKVKLLLMQRLLEAVGTERTIAT